MNDEIKTKSDALKDRFRAGRVPLEADFADLIDIASAGHRALGKDDDQLGLGPGLILNGDCLGVALSINGCIVENDTGLGISISENRGLRTEPDGIAIEDAQLFHRGMIMMWSGDINSLPPGWQLCDGNNGCPDLRDRFIVGAGRKYTPNATGGGKGKTAPCSVSGHVEVYGHALTLNEMPQHSHTYQYPDRMTAAAGAWKGGRGDGDGWKFLTAHNNDTNVLPVKVGKWSDDNTGSAGGTQKHSHGAYFDGSHHEHSFDPTPLFFSLAFIMKV